MTEKQPTAFGSLAGRGVLGGVLMGLANLVPGISGGTMLLAAGIYTDFINAIAEVTTLQFRKRSLVVRCGIGASRILSWTGRGSAFRLDRCPGSVPQVSHLQSELSASAHFKTARSLPQIRLLLQG